MQTPPRACDQRQARAAQRWRMACTLGLVVFYMVVEIIGGLWTNSLALLADAGHMLSDAGALGLSLFAMWIATRPPTARRTFGYHRTEILAALANGATLVAIAIYIFVEAYRRLSAPPEVMGPAMLAIAAGGLVVNLVSLWLLHEGREESLNVHGAFLHVLTDALGSVAAMLAGGLIWAFGWFWADPAISAAIGVLVIYSSWRLIQEAVSVLMESAPRGIDVDEVERAMRGVSGVVAVHDLHVWTITTGLDALCAHVTAAEGVAQHALLSDLGRMLRERFGIEHITLQIEPPEFDGCRRR